MARAEGDGRIDRQHQAAHLAGSHAVLEMTDTDVVDRCSLWLRIRAALPGRPSRVARRSPLLLVSSSVAALLVAGGVPPALAAPCAVSPVTNQSSVSNSGSIDCVSVSGITVTGNVTNTNTGTITADRADPGPASPSTTAASAARSAIPARSLQPTTEAESLWPVAARFPAASSTPARSRRATAAFLSATSRPSRAASAIPARSRRAATAFTSTASRPSRAASAIPARSQRRHSGISVNSVSSFAGGITNSGTISAVPTALSSTAFDLRGRHQQFGHDLGGHTALSSTASRPSPAASAIPARSRRAATGIWVVDVLRASPAAISNSARSRRAAAAFRRQRSRPSPAASAIPARFRRIGDAAQRHCHDVESRRQSAFAGGISNSGTISAGRRRHFRHWRPELHRRHRQFRQDFRSHRSRHLRRRRLDLRGRHQQFRHDLGGRQRHFRLQRLDASRAASPIPARFPAGTGIVVSADFAAAVSVFDSGTITGTGGTAVKLSPQCAPATPSRSARGYSITGTVLGAGSDTFQLGGSGSGTFNRQHDRERNIPASPPSTSSAAPGPRTGSFGQQRRPGTSMAARWPAPARSTARRRQFRRHAGARHAG